MDLGSCWRPESTTRRSRHQPKHTIRRARRTRVDQPASSRISITLYAARVPLRALRGSDVAGIVTGFINLWRGVLTRSEFAAGCATAGVTTSGESETVRAAARRVFELWIDDLTELLEAAGVDPSKAADFAWMLFASTEGALIFARAEHNMRALDLVEQQLLTLGTNLT